MKRFGMVSLGAMTAAERSKGRYMRGPEDHGDVTTVKGLLERHTAAIEEKLGSLGIEEVKNRLADMEARATRPGGRTAETKSFGQQVAESDQFKQLQAANYSGRARIEVKAITTSSGSAGGMISPERDSELANYSRRAGRVRDLLTVVPTSSGSVDYAKQTTRTNNAAPVAEGTQKPYSNYGWTKVNVAVRTIAHLAKLTRQAMDDADQLAGEVDAEMQYGLQLVEDSQILYGDNTGENLYGLVPQATAFSLPTGAVAPTTTIDKLGAAILQQVLTDFPPDGIVLHPVDWFNMRMMKDAAGAYLFGEPGAVVEPKLFGLPIVPTQAMVVNTFLLGSFRLQKLYERMAIEALISTENDKDFELNLATLRIEERVALAARQPGALIKGSL